MVQCFRVECSEREDNSAAYGVNPRFAREDPSYTALACNDHDQIRVLLGGANPGECDIEEDSGKNSGPCRSAGRVNVQGSRR